MKLYILTSTGIYRGKNLKVSEILDVLTDANLLLGSANLKFHIDVKGLKTDSRKLTPQDGFIAYKGVQLRMPTPTFQNLNMVVWRLLSVKTRVF